MLFTKVNRLFGVHAIYSAEFECTKSQQVSKVTELAICRPARSVDIGISRTYKKAMSISIWKRKRQQVYHSKALYVFN